MPYKDPIKRAEIKRRWHEAHPNWRQEWKDANPDYHLLRTHGITKAHYDNMVKAQEGLCLICREQPDILVVDHSHETGFIRRLLCGNCNSGMGMLKDDPARLPAAATYLLRAKT